MFDSLFAYLDDLFVHLESARWAGESLRLEFAVRALSAEEEWSRWRVDCQGVLDYRFEQAHGYLELGSAEHLLVRQCVAARHALYFYGRPGSVDALIVKLLEAHRRVSDGWIPFGRYLNRADSLRKLLAHGHGKFASGPDFLMRAYADLLGTEDIRCSMLLMQEGLGMENTGMSASIGSPAVLIFGDSFVVAGTFVEVHLREAGDQGGNPDGA